MAGTKKLFVFKKELKALFRGSGIEQVFYKYLKHLV